MAIAAALILLASVPLGPEPAKPNASAARVAALSVPLGIDFDEKNPKSPHPDPGDVAALSGAGFGAWLDAQIQNDTDEIGDPPPAIQEFLGDRREALWGVISTLEKDDPDWGALIDGDGINPRLLPTIRLERMLLATALVEERGGNRIDSGRALEASWSLERGLSSDSTVISQLISSATEKLRAGALRKMKEPTLQWQARLSGDGPWKGMLDAIAREGRYRNTLNGVEGEMFEQVAVKAYTAITDALRKDGPCVLATMSDEDIWRPAAQALSAETSAEKRQIRDMYESIALPGLANQLRRAARIEVDRELTLKILRLRLEKEGSKDGQWPVKLIDATSAVCSTASYGYQSADGGVELRFEGSIDVPNMGAVLPLSFHSGKSKATRTPTPTPAPERLDSRGPRRDDGASMNARHSNSTWWWREATR